MQIDTHTLHRLFTAVQQGHAIGHVDGYMVQHDTHYNGHETRYSLRCINPNLGNKLAWQVWMIPGRRPTASDIDKSCVNRSFDTSLIQQHDGLWYFDPEKVITLSAPTALYGGMPPQACVSSYRSGQIPSTHYSPFGPSDYPFAPVPGSPGNQPQWQRDSILNPYQKFGVQVATHVAPQKMVTANGILHRLLLNSEQYAAYNQTRIGLLAFLENTKNWEWSNAQVMNNNPKAAFTYSTVHTTPAADAIILNLLRNELQESGYTIDELMVEEKYTILHITIEV